MSNQPIAEEPTAAYLFSLIGGILGVIGSIILLIAGFSFTATSIYSPALAASIIAIVYIAISIYGLITSSLIIWSASQLKNNPQQSQKWGTIILVLSIIGFGGWLGIIGGILALIWKPSQGNYSQQPSYTKACLRCGRIMPANAKFCPYCGTPTPS